jgi:hypothetical protein
MRSRPDDAGPNEPEPDFPETCPICGSANVTDDGELLDESRLTCGKPECIQAQEQRDVEDRAADAAAERCYEEQWRRELEEKDPEP